MASKWQLLIQEQTDLRKELTALHQTITTEGRERTGEEKERGIKVLDRLKVLEEEITFEREARDALRQIEGLPDANEMAAAAQTAGPVAPFTYKGDWTRGFGAQLKAVATSEINRSIDPRLGQIQAASGASEALQSDGGFLVQFDFSNELLNLVHQTGNLVGRVTNTTIGANSNGLRINAIDETSRVNGSRYGGVQAYWTAEAAALTGSKPKFRQLELNLQKLTGLYYATDEILMDTDALGQVAARAFAEEFGFKLDDAFIRGSGGGMPLGVLGHAGTLSIAKETGQDANTIWLQNIEKMYARMLSSSKAMSIADSNGRFGQKGAEWFINADTWPQLFALSQAVGVGGMPVFIPPGGIAGAPFGTLLGRRINELEQCATLGTVGDILFADWSQYMTIDKGGIEAASSIHVQFLTDETTFRFILRYDGMPIRNALITPFQGTATQSAFVTLATRA